MKKFFWSGFILAAVMMVAACSTPTAMVVATEVPTVQLTFTEAPRPSDTPMPSPTSTFTPPPTATETCTPTVTLTATPAIDLASAKIASMQHTGESSMYIVFEIKGLQQPYRVQINGYSYECQLSSKFPSWLVCQGQRISYGKPVRVKYFEPGSDVVAYETLLTLPEGVPPTPLPEGAPQTWCPQRGQNITCETENRVDNFGNPCIVSTCFDACGYYYSINNCPDTPGPNLAPVRP